MILYFKLAFLSALASTLWNNINDCDETYNYLEPLNFILNSSNTAFETWEYSPKFALRSYFYLWVIGWPALVLRIFSAPSWLVFLFIRLQLSTLSAVANSLLAHYSSKRLFPDNHFKGRTFGIVFCVVHFISPGNFISSSSTVPSAYCATMVALMMAFWINGNIFYAVGAVAFGALVLWPFAACFGIPLAVSLLFSGKTMKLIKFSFIWMLIFLSPMILVDSYYYGRITFPTWNIISYNVFSALKSHSSSQLYGTEPCMFYLKNYLLNFNIVFIYLAVLIPLYFFFITFKYFRQPEKKRFKNKFNLYGITFLPFLIWNFIFFLQSHKEERFLFPCFSCISLAVSLLLSVLLVDLKFSSWFITRVLRILVIISLTIFTVLSLSRILALTVGYNAPMFLVQHLPPAVNQQILCVGRDWHHYPSSFLLPSRNNGSWKVEFLKSDFGGQLPGKFAKGGNITEATRIPVSNFNDMNLQESDRFYDIEKCDFVLDRYSIPGANEIQYSEDKLTWKLLLNRTILARPEDLSGKSYPTRLSTVFSSLKRSFYIPFIFKHENMWIKMHILERI